jgi:hypothetical protein
MKATAIRLRERADDRQQPPSPLCIRYLFFGTRRRIELLFGPLFVTVHPRSVVIPRPLLQRKVVSHTKHPSPQICPGFPTLKMPEEREEYFLRHFLSILGVETE